MTTKRVYKILDCATGLYSTGGVDPGWTKNGKTWSSIGALKNHLNVWRSGGRWLNRAIPQTWVVEVFEVSVQTANEIYDARAVAAGEAP